MARNDTKISSPNGKPYSGKSEEAEEDGFHVRGCVKEKLKQDVKFY